MATCYDVTGHDIPVEANLGFLEQLNERLTVKVSGMCYTECRIHVPLINKIAVTYDLSSQPAVTLDHIFQIYNRLKCM